ncbi:TIGR03862 family flavoprotein [Methylomonas sp. DH-1]|uniref:TIGR03862 family flavoprotein n=1 Tax=Methylomonas sp. (strain DH-1) TaxID=1727196 RepID=UPI0007C94D0A|nr:TIGR03862 family flavoprotein [Methylomonas sp. DH-1]ANE53947.1 NAD(FAD)-utilizing dehydrogenase [Methylomonas sp. DH-1]
MPAGPAAKVAIVGAGPAGLMAAEVISQAGIAATVYDAMPSAGRKFLMAGKGGMNITHAEAFDAFLSRYGPRRAELEPMLQAFTPDDLRAWVKGLGIATFVGSSGRVFPTEMKAAPLLRAWLHRLRSNGVQFRMRHRWLGWADGALRFATPDGERHVQADATLLALGGGSWPQLGSTGAWTEILAVRGIGLSPLRPANCGFETDWSDVFRQRCAGQPLKSVVATFRNNQGETFSQQGELTVADYGLEGGLIYALSAPLRDAIAAAGAATLWLDLLPDRSPENIAERLAKPRGKDSLSNYLRKRLAIDGVKTLLLREALPAAELNNSVKLAAALKALPIVLHRPRPIAEAISSAGGVEFEELEQNLMLRKLPGTFCAGEMLDWEAPTGGYLLTTCLASGRMAGLGAVGWLRS